MRTKAHARDATMRRALLCDRRSLVCMTSALERSGRRPACDGAAGGERVWLDRGVRKHERRAAIDRKWLRQDRRWRRGRDRVVSQAVPAVFEPAQQRVARAVRAVMVGVMGMMDVLAVLVDLGVLVVMM